MDRAHQKLLKGILLSGNGLAGQKL